MRLENRKLGDLVASNYRIAGILQQHDIDFCCGGDKTVGEACEEKGLDISALDAEIKALKTKPTSEAFPDFRSMSPELLIQYIQKRHHQYLINQLPVLSANLDKLCRQYGETYPELIKLKSLFNSTVEDLPAHLESEEKFLFPFIKRMSFANKAGISISCQPIESLDNLLNDLSEEHKEEGAKLEAIRELTNDFLAPENACAAHIDTYKQLKEFVERSYEHVHLENNILFPEAVKLDS